MKFSLRSMSRLSLVGPKVLCLLHGGLWAMLWGSWLLGSYLQYGGGLVARTANVGGMLCAIAGGGWLVGKLLRNRGLFVRDAASWGGYAIAAAASGWCLTGRSVAADWLLGFAPESMVWEAAVLFATAWGLFAVPFAVVVGVGMAFGRNQRMSVPGSEGAGAVRPFWDAVELAGAGLCLLFVFPELTRLVGWTAMNWMGAGVGVGVLAYRWWFADQAMGQAVSPKEKSQESEAGWAVVAGVVSAGVLVAALERVVAQLVPATSEILVGIAGMILLGAACGGLIGIFWVRFSSLEKFVQNKIGGVSGWGAGLGLLVALGCVAAFPWGVRYSMWVNQSFSGGWWIYAARLLLVGGLFLPVGLLAGARSGRGADFGTGRIVLFAAAWVVGSWVLPRVGVEGVLWLAVMPVFVNVLTGMGRLAGNVQGGWKTTGFRVAGACLVACAGLCVLAGRNYEPGAATHWLTAARFPESRGMKLGNPLILELSDIRPVEERVGTNGELTLWKSREAYLQLRENGVPKGTFSADLKRHPDYSAELLMGVLPPALHDSPAKMLLLGLGGGTPLAGMIDAPVQRIDCVEGDPASVELVRDALREGGGINWDDDRLRMLSANPQAWLAGGTEKYDVIISNPDPVAFPGTAASFTREYYERVSRRLEAGGLFCQRLQCVDFGWGPFAQVAATLGEVFPDVMMIETAESDFLFVAAKDGRGVVRAQLIERIQAPQVMKSMSRLGWDSLLAMTLPVAGDAALKQLVGGGTRGLSNADGGMLVAWPREISRSGNKSGELHARLAAKTSKLLEMIPEEAQTRVVLRRLGEIQAQNDLILKYPDQYWAYRKNAKEEVSKNPKTLISQIDFAVNKGKLDPEDRRRMSYFGLLGRAAKTLQLEDIQRMERFVTPFDPLISPFIPQEIAELYARAGHPEPAEELRHRLQRIYYSGPGDRSVLYVVDALTLINDHPSAVPDARQRRETQNSLLQVLKQRWDVRKGGNAGLPRVMYRDANLSLAAIELTLAQMRENCDAAGVSRLEHGLRQSALQRILIQPLQSYSQSLRPYLTPSEIANKGLIPRADETADKPEEKRTEGAGVQAN